MATKNDAPATEEEIKTKEMEAKDTAPVDDVVEEPIVEEPEAKSEVKEEPEKPESARERVARRYKERRQETISTDGTIYDPEPEPEPMGAEPEAGKGAPKPEKEPEGPGKEATSGDDPILKLKIDGQEIELPQSEVVKRAQVNTAIATRERQLEELNTEISRRRAALETPRQADTTGQEGEPTDKAPDKPTQLDPARLREIAEDIRSGTDEEGYAALVELAEALQPEPQPAVDVNRIVETTSARIRAEQAVTDAIGQFATDYPEITEDEDLQTMVYNQVVKEMVTDLANAGVAGVYMDRVKNASVEDLARIHREFHTRTGPDGKPHYPMVRGYSEILSASGDHVRGKFGRPQQPAPEPKPNGLSDRTARKQELTPQPKATQQRAQPETATPPGGRPDPKAAVRKLAAMRRPQPVA